MILSLHCSREHQGRQVTLCLYWSWESRKWALRAASAKGLGQTSSTHICPASCFSFPLLFPLSPAFCFTCFKFYLTHGNLRATYTFWGRRYITGKHIIMNNNCEKYFLFSWSVFFRFNTWSELLFRILRYKELSLDNTNFFFGSHTQCHIIF